MTEQSIIKDLFLKWGKSGISACNMYYYRFESDMITLSKSGYITEYEVKLTKSDFYADLKKTAIHNRKSITRHNMLISGQAANRFYYVLPKGMVPEEDIPKWAGIIYIRPADKWNEPALTIYRAAPRIHGNKAHEKAENKILTCMYWKSWRNITL